MKIGEKEITIKELKRKDVRNKFTGLTGEAIQEKLINLACGLTEEEIGELSLKDYLILSQEFEKVNGVGDAFQIPQEN